MSVARTARERVHEEVAGEILAVARGHLAREGAGALSLRSVARELGLAPSALYRYFPGRDALLSALILSAYGSLADEAERAAGAAFTEERGDAERGDAERWLAVPRAMRRWALAHPHEWALIFGTPVPGYEAPLDTVVPYARVATALVQPVMAANRAGRLQVESSPPVVDQELLQAMAPVIEAFPDVPVAKTTRLLQAWTMVIGAISLELFGHWRNTILEPELFFDQTMRDIATSLGLTS